MIVFNEYNNSVGTWLSGICDLLLSVGTLGNRSPFCYGKREKMNIEELLNYLLTPASQVALIIALAEIAKRVGIKTKYIPLLDLALGLVSGICVFGIMLGHGTAQGVVIGVTLGLSACGLFSGIKNVAEKEK